MQNSEGHSRQNTEGHSRRPPSRHPVPPRWQRFLTASLAALVLVDLAAAEEAAGAAASAHRAPAWGAVAVITAAPAVRPVAVGAVPALPPPVPRRSPPLPGAAAAALSTPPSHPASAAAIRPAPTTPPRSTTAPLAARPFPPPTTSIPPPAPPVPPPTTTPPPARPSATRDPAVSSPPDNAFEQACWTPAPDATACNQAALADIDRARAGEGLGPLTLPPNFAGLSPSAQLVAVADAERTSRGLPALAESTALDRTAQQGAVDGRDPTGPAGYTWDSNYALGDPTALAADFSWMYDDGPGSQNVDCTASNASGCWGHRHNILSPWAGSAGAAAATYQGRPSLTQLFVKQ